MGWRGWRGKWLERQRTEGCVGGYQLSVESGHSGRGPATLSMQHSCCWWVTDVPCHSLDVLQRDLLWLGAGVDPLLDVQGREAERSAALHLHGEALLEHVAAALGESGPGVGEPEQTDCDPRTGKAAGPGAQLGDWALLILGCVASMKLLRL